MTFNSVEEAMIRGMAAEAEVELIELADEMGILPEHVRKLVRLIRGYPIQVFDLPDPT